MVYQWYPGHMTKTVRQIEEQIRLIDLVIEIVDARIPMASRNPDLDHLSKGRERMFLFGKTDLAEEKASEEWMNCYRDMGLHPYACDLRKNSAIKRIMPLIREVCSAKIERARRKGILNRPILLRPGLRPWLHSWLRPDVWVRLLIACTGGFLV